MHFDEKRNGFTIVELLIVIVVIGILAAIVIVAFNGIQERANTTAVRSDLSAISKKLELFKADSPTGSYPATAQLASADIKASKNSYYATTERNNFYYCVHINGSSYALGAVTKNNKSMILNNGTISDVSVVYQAQTSAAVDSSTSNSSCASGWTSGPPATWSGWVK